MAGFHDTSLRTIDRASLEGKTFVTVPFTEAILIFRSYARNDVPETFDFLELVMSKHT